MPPATLQDEIEYRNDMMPDEFYETRTEQWHFLDPAKVSSSKEKALIHRLNSLGSSLYFIKVVLRRRRLTEALHSILCNQLEATHLKEVIEWPRDHFKSTICSEGFPIWWALPFTSEDEDWMCKLGYGDEWVTWMRRAHNQNTRTLLISENITNAQKINFRISQHYESNDFFKHLFPEIQPNEKCKWTEQSMHQLRTKDSGPQGEGTFDCLGVGGALQSRHYDRMVPDDLVGRKAISSETVMDSTIEWFKLIVGAMDSSETNADIDNDEIIVGNRWAINDLNAWIRANLPYYRFTNHSALGGCCKAHPLGQPIFPEEFSVGKLLRWKARLGSRLFACQFLNNPLAEGSVRWKKEYLNYFHYESTGVVIGKKPTGENLYSVKIVHETKNGILPASIMPRELVVRMIVDPNHSGNTGRCRHAITITGTLYKKVTNDAGYTETQKRVYLLETWADTCSYEELDNKICYFVQKWKLRRFWLEVVAAQKYLKHHLEYLFKQKNIHCKIEPLKENKAENAKFTRIEAMDTLFESGQFFCQRKDILFDDEYSKYATRNANKSLIDILDTLGYYNEVCDDTNMSMGDVAEFMQKANANNPYKPQNRIAIPQSVTGY